MLKDLKALGKKKLLGATAVLALAATLMPSPFNVEGETNTASAASTEATQRGYSHHSGTIDLANVLPTSINEEGEIEVWYEDATCIYIPYSLKDVTDFISFSWKQQSDNSYKMTLTGANGIEITETKDPVYVQINRDNKNVVYKSNGTTGGTPFMKKNDTFVIKVSRYTGTYEFTDKTYTFDDIKNHQLRPYIEALASREIIKGVTATEFKPEASITKAQMSALFSRSLGLTPKSKAGFSDVQNHWAKNEIASMFDIGVYTQKDITNAITKNAGKLNPDKAMTRAETILFVYRAMKSQGVEMPVATPKFNDVADLGKDKELLEAAGSLQALGIFVGSNGNLKPKSNVTRAQTAKVLQMALEHIEKY